MNTACTRVNDIMGEGKDGRFLSCFHLGIGGRGGAPLSLFPEPITHKQTGKTVTVPRGTECYSEYFLACVSDSCGSV